MSWRKLGRVHLAGGELAWQRSHAYCPTPLEEANGCLRVLCSFLDSDRVGRVGWVDVDPEEPARVLAVSGRPALDVGRPGTFDEHGVTPLSVVRAGGRLRLYYAGWQRGVGVRYSLFTGVAESDDGGESFERVSRAPVLDRSDAELHVRSSVHVRPDGDGFRMWYAGGSEWVNGSGSAKPRYALRELRSPDGLAWGDEGRVVFAPEGGEIGFSRPYVLDEGGRLRMWYSVRTAETYRLGYAESADGGESWERRDSESGLEPSAVGWDSEMVGLASIAETSSGRLLFYNGNNYGETGFGVARWEDA